MKSAANQNLEGQQEWIKVTQIYKFSLKNPSQRVAASFHMKLGLVEPPPSGKQRCFGEYDGHHPRRVRLPVLAGKCHLAGCIANELQGESHFKYSFSAELIVQQGTHEQLQNKK